MIKVSVLIPVLARPSRVEPLLGSLRAAAPPAHLRVEVEPVFLCSPGDDAEVAAVREAGVEPLVVPWEPGRGDYARKMNHGIRETRGDFVFLAADDLLFHPGWAEAAIAEHLVTHACVVGTNDVGNERVVAGRHSTHTLVSRAYAACGTVDDPSMLLTEQYGHVFVDDEFIQTAMYRQTYAHAHRSVVEHLHPHWGKAEHDETYAKGQRSFEDDRMLYERRRNLWDR